MNKRDEFEVFVKRDSNLPLDRDSYDEYADMNTALLWYGWKAALTHGRTELAATAPSMSGVTPGRAHAAGMSMQGRRVMPTSEGYLIGLDKPGDYGRVTRTLKEVHGFDRQLWWQVIAPDGSSCSLNPAVHTVIEHDDNTITVHPSIVTSTWHGWLERGLWRQCA